MNNATVKKFQGVLESANGNKAKMKEAFKSIAAYRASSLAKMKSGQNLTDYLDKNPGVKKIYEWSGTVLVNTEYQLFNY